MFDYSEAEVEPWPERLPFGSRHTELWDVVWRVEDGERVLDAFIQHAPPSGAADYWRFRAWAPLAVIVSEDERQETSLWRRRDEICNGAQGFLVVKNSPILAALLKNEPHAVTGAVEHFVLGTDWAVAHILCADVPTLTSIPSPPNQFEIAQ